LRNPFWTSSCRVDGEDMTAAKQHNGLYLFGIHIKFVCKGA